MVPGPPPFRPPLVSDLLEDPRDTVEESVRCEPGNPLGLDLIIYLGVRYYWGELPILEI